MPGATAQETADEDWIGGGLKHGQNMSKRDHARWMLFVVSFFLMQFCRLWQLKNVSSK